MRVELDELRDCLIGTAVAGIAVRLAVQPDRIIRTGRHGRNVRAVVIDDHAAVLPHGDAVRRRRVFNDRFRLVIFQLRAFAGAQIHAENGLRIRIVGNLLPVLIGVGLLAAVRHACGEIEQITGHAARADPLNILRQVKELRLIGILRRSFRRLAALIVLICIIRCLCILLAAARQYAEQQDQHKQSGKNPFFHDEQILLSISISLCCHMVTDILQKRKAFGLFLRKT